MKEEVEIEVLVLESTSSSNHAHHTIVQHKNPLGDASLSGENLSLHITANFLHKTNNMNQGSIWDELIANWLILGSVLNSQPNDDDERDDEDDVHDNGADDAATTVNLIIIDRLS